MARSGKGSGGNEDVKNEQPLQAIVLADAFTQNMRPVTLEVSRDPRD